MIKSLIKGSLSKPGYKVAKKKSIVGAIYSLIRKDSYLKRVGWFESFRQGMPCEENKIALPWFTYGAIAFLEKRINKEMYVFEYGSGNSTIWWSGRASKVVSCEHDRKWYFHMKSKLANNVEYLHFDLVSGGDYSKEILKYKDTFDIVVIDGRDRVNCARNSIPALKSNGVIIWDNSDREKYTEGYDFLIANGFRRLDFVGMGPIGSKGWCTSVFYRSNNCLCI
jgi:hypothetical protein